MDAARRDVRAHPHPHARHDLLYSTQYCTVYSIVFVLVLYCTVSCVLCTVSCVLCTVYSYSYTGRVLCTVRVQYSYTVHSTQYTVHSTQDESWTVSWTRHTSMQTSQTDGRARDGTGRDGTSGVVVVVAMATESRRVLKGTTKEEENVEDEDEDEDEDASRMGSFELKLKSEMRVNSDDECDVDDDDDDDDDDDEDEDEDAEFREVHETMHALIRMLVRCEATVSLEPGGSRLGATRKRAQRVAEMRDMLKKLESGMAKTAATRGFELETITTHDGGGSYRGTFSLEELARRVDACARRSTLELEDEADVQRLAMDMGKNDKVRVGEGRHKVADEAMHSKQDMAKATTTTQATTTTHRRTSAPTSSMRVFDAKASSMRALSRDDEAELGRQRAIQEGLTDEMSDLASALKRNALALEQGLERSNKVLNDVETRLERNVDGVKSSVRRQTAVYTANRRGSCWTWIIFFVVGILFAWTYVVIKMTTDRSKRVK